jgi:hypothetical protein
VAININLAMTTHISFNATFLHVLILEHNVKRTRSFQILCCVYLLVSFTISFIRAVSEMFSDAPTVSKLDMSNCVPWITKCFPYYMLISCHTNFIDTLQIPSSCLSSVTFLCSSPSFTLSLWLIVCVPEVTNWV